MVSHPDTDRESLITQQYATGRNLAARANIYRWQKPRFDLIEWVLDQVSWTGTESVLDAGCGYGAYLDRLRKRAPKVIGVDVSLGMLREATAIGVPLVNCDVQQLPFARASFDVAIAPHMLYHVPNIDAAVAELRRALRPGGLALAVTNAGDDKPEVMRLIEHASGSSAYIKIDRRFLLEDGRTLFRRHFADVTITEARTELRVPEANPVVAYLDSIRSAAEHLFGLDWDTFLGRAKQIVATEIRARGAFRITTHAGVIVAR